MADPTLALAAAARSYARHLGAPPHETLTICIKIASTGQKLFQLPVYPGVPEVTAAGTPILSAKQKRILAALIGGPMKGDTLAAELGYGNRSSLSGGRGLKDLMSAGLVEMDRDDGYRLTDAGEDVAAEVADG